MTGKMKFGVVDGGRCFPKLVQGTWDVMIDDQPPDQADRLVIDCNDAHWNGQPVSLRFNGEQAIVDLGAHHYEIKRHHADPTRTDRFDAALVVGRGEKIHGLMDRA